MSAHASNATPRWTAEQQRAIDHVEGDLLVSAAAGSGKTAVLAQRCARLVAEGYCSVDGLLVLTFTEAAANEMRSRIAAALREKLSVTGAGALPGKVQAAWLAKQAALVERASISTLHAFCARLLRQFFHEAQVDPAFELLDEEEADLLRQETLTELIAAWHNATTPGHAPSSESQISEFRIQNSTALADFPDFYEAYAQGRDGALAEMILSVHFMLASTADPAAWASAAGEVYTKEGAPQTLEIFVRTVVLDRLDLLLQSARRAIDTLGHRGVAGTMLANLQRLLAQITAAYELLGAQGAAGWDNARVLLDNDAWDTIRKTKDAPEDFDELKKRTWARVKDSYDKLLRKYLINDRATLLSDLRLVEPHVRTLLALVEDFGSRYAAAKRQQNRLDFSDLERLALELLTKAGSRAAAECRGRYQHILVDEFQDINPLQAALLEAVRNPEAFGGRGNLFVVGDVKQSIYGFRLAEPGLFLEREAAAKKSNTPREQAYVPLANNFRSQPKLLGIMNALFEKLLTRRVTGIDYADGHVLQAAPVTNSDTPIPRHSDTLPFTGTPLELLIVTTAAAEEDEERDGAADASSPEAATDTAKAPVENLTTVEAEARAVAGRIKLLMAESRGIAQKDGAVRPLRYRDIAILLRSMKNKALIFARALATEGIPVHADLSTGYFDAPEVRHVLALLQVLDNPQQDIPLATALLSPFGRFSFDDLAQIRLAYDRQSVPFAQAAARLADEGVGVADASLRARLRAFFAMLARYRAEARTRPLHEALSNIYADSHIIPYLNGLEAGVQRVANLQMLHQRALQFAGFRKQGLHRFLRFIERLREQEGDFGEAPVLSEASDVVRIMSVHKSKGLEFPVVVVSGLGSQFNIDRAPFVHRDLHLGLKLADVERNAIYPTAASLALAHAADRAARAEELRLLYVALTRARDQLILTGTVKEAERVAALRADAEGITGELPADLILKAKNFLEWIIPALANNRLRVQWPNEAISDPQVTISVQQPIVEAEAKTDILEPVSESPEIQNSEFRIQNSSLLLRLTSVYPYETFTRQPAVVTVTELKKMLDEDEESGGVSEFRGMGERADTPTLRQPDTSSDSARVRGIATHRILELLDFTAVTSPELLRQIIDRLLKEKRLSSEEVAAADLAGIDWFLTTATVKKIAAGARAGHLYRELGFTWTTPGLGGVGVDTKTPLLSVADAPTIRGIIDVLLADPAARSAEIFDYKTDAANNWLAQLPHYQQQMRYYLRAATDILGYRVSRATLLFLAARKEEVVTLG